MATISVNSVCAGGDHVRLTATTARGQFTRTISKQDLRQAIDDVALEDFLLRQLAALIRANPSATPNQLRTIIESYTFLE
jgi:hypothetical protein